MMHQIARLLPFFLAGLLLLNLVTAALDGGRSNWLLVAVLALLLAGMVLWRTRAADNTRQP